MTYSPLRYIEAVIFVINYVHMCTVGSKDTSTPAIQHEDLLSSASGSSSKPKLPSFWVPALTPDAKPTEIKKPVS